MSTTITSRSPSTGQRRRWRPRTALIGGYGDNDGLGAVWVFTRSGGTLWSWTSCHISWGTASCDEGGRW
jgi:hypothetical protein